MKLEHPLSPFSDLLIGFQIQGYDDAADEDEPQLLATPCIRSLVEFTGVTLTKRLEW